MKKKKKAILTFTLFSLVALSIAFAIFKMQGGFRVPSDGLIPHSEEEKVVWIESVDRFQTAIGSDLFATSYTLKGADIKSFLSQPGCHTLALYNGLTISGSMSPANRVLIMVPVNASMQTMRQSNFLVFPGASNMTQTLSSFADDDLNPSLQLPARSVGYNEATTYINNYSQFSPRDNIKGILLPRNTIDRICFSNNPSLPQDIRISHGIDLGGKRVVLVSALEVGRGNVNPNNSSMQLLGVSALCPSNCDLY